MKHLLRDLDQLKKDILTVGAMVEEATAKAIASFVQRQPERAQEVIDGDREIDRREVEVEESCLKTLALHQPVAADLRFVITVLKVNNDLERMGDLAANIAKRGMALSDRPVLPETEALSRMALKVKVLLARSLDALVNHDSELARSVCLLDDEIDDANRKMFRDLQAAMAENPEIIETAVTMLSMSRNLERIADLSTNIAEDVVFMVEGELIRHPLL